jgi:histone deacetylase 6
MPLNNLSFLFFPSGNDQPYASSGSESDVEDVDELPDAVSSVDIVQIVDDGLSERITMLKLDQDNVATKNTSSCTTVEQSPTDSVQAQNDGSVVVPTRIYDLSFTWRSALSKVYVWYASFGSNMWTPRFLCYIEGGKVMLKTHRFLYLGRTITFRYLNFL